MRYCERATAASSVRGGRAQTEHRQREREKDDEGGDHTTTEQKKPTNEGKKQQQIFGDPLYILLAKCDIEKRAAG